jgi:hypothetical protein
MNVVDSSGWLEYFADGPNADFFAPAVENLEKLLVPSIKVSKGQSMLRDGDDLHLEKWGERRASARSPV